MPAIAGFIGAAERSPSGICSNMLDSLSGHGRDGRSIIGLHNAFFGVQFFHTLPEDDFDRQPYVGNGERVLLAADARIDNREEIAAALNIPSPELKSMSDSKLLLRAWERWGLGLAGQLLGDIAMAAWDSRSDELALIRTPLSNCPLFYCRRPGFIAFSSLPSALFAIPSVRSEPNVDAMAELLAGGIYRPREATMFNGIESVPQGHALLLGTSAKKLTKLWSLGEPASNVSIAEAGEAMRSELDRAVQAQSRRRSGPVACQLSGGRDSSAVASSAALFEDRVIGFTAAPREGFAPLNDDYWLADESGLASETAQQAGLHHVICRPGRPAIVPSLEALSALHFQPIGNPVNLPWIAQTCSAAKACGANILLTGGYGNFALSLGGLGFLGEYWRMKGLKDWWNLAGALHHGGAAWRSLLSVSFGHLIPLPAYQLLRRLSGKSDRDRYDLPLLKGSMRREAEQIRRERFGDGRAPASRRNQFAEILLSVENGDKYSLPTWGVDVRDPTADRRFIELCYSFPVEAFLSAETARPAYAAAFRERLPAKVIAGKQAGYQAADWYETVNPAEIRSALGAYARHPLVNEMLDMAAIEARLDDWPKRDGGDIETYDLYCNQLIGALALATFIDIHFPA